MLFGNCENIGEVSGMREITQPDWFKRLPGDAYINAKEVVKMFGYSDKTTASQLARIGSIPKPDRVCQLSSHKNLMWQVSSIRKYLNEVNKCKI